MKTYDFKSLAPNSKKLESYAPEKITIDSVRDMFQVMKNNATIIKSISNSMAGKI